MSNPHSISTGLCRVLLLRQIRPTSSILVPIFPVARGRSLISLFHPSCHFQTTLKSNISYFHSCSRETLQNSFEPRLPLSFYFNEISESLFLNERLLRPEFQRMANNQQWNGSGSNGYPYGFNPNASSFNPKWGTGQASGQQQQQDSKKEKYLPPRLKKKQKQKEEELARERREINSLEKSLKRYQYGEDWKQQEQQQQQQAAFPQDGYNFSQYYQQNYNPYPQWGQQQQQQQQQPQHGYYHQPQAQPQGYGNQTATQSGWFYGAPPKPFRQETLPQNTYAPPPPVINSAGYPVPYFNNLPYQAPVPPQQAPPPAPPPASSNNNNDNNDNDGNGKKKKKKKNKGGNKNNSNQPRPYNNDNSNQPRPNKPPSRQSGGIPNPTDSYLLQSSLPHSPSPTVRPLLIVLDLNGTLLHRPKTTNSHSFVSRPFATEFLSYVINTFTVVIWSSARPENVKKMCDVLLTQEQQSRVVAIWGRDKFGLTQDDYNAKVQVYKRLTKIWSDPTIAASYPHTEGCWDMSNTVLIDDSAEKARSEPFNCITLPEFTGNDEAVVAGVKKTDDDDADVDMAEDDGVNKKKDNNTLLVLPMVHEYLNRLALQKDVSCYIRAWPFNVHDEQLRAQAEYRSGGGQEKKMNEEGGG
ncbi:hypothetical protein QBC38DRAFT_500576 [Podospora fimiseda]|uniref:FCP1 homology domain-containing protein n=1 Tax=Podospora fimiseda TaxID=252190 RepID=A0AAN7H0Y9_9PEZI|nr:hypothetical protein QBC38DRAFT_500576 [Podospora fimiseda]